MIKGEFAEQILSGRKTATIRLGKIVPKVRELIMHSGGRPIAKVRIKSVVYKRISELNEDDVKKDGYSSVAQLIEDLERLYKWKVNPNDIVTVIEFEVVKKLTDLEKDSVYMGLTPTDIAALANRYLRGELSEEDFRIINAVLRYRSIRAASLKLFGSLSKRWLVRRVIKNCLSRLLKKNVIGVESTKA